MCFSLSYVGHYSVSELEWVKTHYETQVEADRERGVEDLDRFGEVTVIEGIEKELKQRAEAGELIDS